MKTVRAGVRPEERGSVIRTFLIADVRGYTPFTKAHGDEAAARLAVKFEQVAREGAEAFGGEVIGVRGDEVVVAFSSARRALRTSVELQDAFAHETALEPTFPLSVGIGVAAGEAVPVADGFRGGALNLAARLCAQAKAGEVLASEELVGLAGAVRGITFESLGPFELKGLDAPVQVTKVVSAEVKPRKRPSPPAEVLGPRSDLPAELDSATPLVGRERELRWLRWFWRRARHGQGRAVFLSGPSGMGKTRLAAEIACVAHAQGALVVYAACAGPANEALGKLRAAGGADGAMLVVADDLDAAGGTLLDTISALVSSITERPFLVLGTYMDGHSPMVSSLLGRADPSAEARLELASLEAEHVRAIAALYAGRALAGLPLAELLDETDGVPALVHRAAGDWARERASERLSASASRTASDRSGLRAAEAELTASVIDLQRVNEGTSLYVDERVDAVVCPFKGLATFETSDADYFFGRERLVAEFVARLVGTSFLGIVGPSGSGKSSTVRAGFLPALAAGVIPGSARWRQVLLRPGEHPMSALEEALQAEELTATLMRAAEQALEAVPVEGERLVIVVDQFEELFTVCRDEAERARFVSALATPHEGTIVLVALRADFYGRCAAYPELAELLAANHVLVGPMQDDELRRAIELPARRAGLRVEPELVETLVADVEGEPGGLPLLSTALLELWQRRESRELSMERYRATGGVRGAVARLAEEAYGRLTPQEQLLARAMLLRLAGHGEGAVERKRVALADLDVEHNEAAARVLSVLTDARLLTTSDGTVEVAHEALLREWPRLRSWLEEDVGGRRLHQHLIKSAREWDERGRDEADLYRGARLGAALDWTSAHTVELNERERRFLDASGIASERETERQRRTNRRLLVLLGVVAVLLVVALVAGTFAFVLGARAQKEARIATARELAAAAEASLEDDPERSVLLAIEALETTRREDGTVLRGAEEALHEALARSRTVLTLPGAGSVVAFAPNGRRFVSAGFTRSATVWDAEAGQRVRMLAGHTGGVRAVDYSPDGRLIATGSADRTAKLWNAGTGAEIESLEGHRGEVISVQFSPDGRLVATVGQDRTARVWDTGTGRQLRTFEAWRGGPALAPYGRDLASFSPDGRLVVANVRAPPAGRAVRVWDLSTGKLVRTGDLLAIEEFRPHDIDVSPDGTLLAGVSVGELGLWRLPHGELVDLVPAHGTDIWDVEFSRDGNRLATASADGTAKLWEVTSAGVRELPGLPGHVGEVATVAFGGDEESLLTGSRDGTVRVFDLSAAAGRELLVFPGPVDTPSGEVKFTPDGRGIVATSGPEGMVRMWDTATGRKRRQLEHPARGTASNLTVFGIDVSADGSRVATASGDGTASMWDAKTGKSPLVTFLGHDVDCPPENECAVLDVKFSPDGTRVATASTDFTARIFAAESGRELRVFEGHTGWVSSLDISPDGTRLATASIDGTARIWDAHARSERELFSVSHKGRGSVEVVYAPGGARFLTAGSDGEASFWDARDGAPLLGFSTGQGGIYSVAFSPDGARLATGGADGTVKLWNATTGEAQLTLIAPTDSLAFSPDGKLLAVQGALPQPAVRVLALDVDRLLEVARDRVTRSLTEEECRQYLHVDRCPGRD